MGSQQNDGSPDTSCLYVWLSRDADGVEGMIAFPVGDAIMPLISADEERARGFEPVAYLAALARQQSAHLVRFVRAETLREIGP